MNDNNSFFGAANNNAREEGMSLNKFAAKTFMWMFIGLLATFATAFVLSTTNFAYNLIMKYDGLYIGLVIAEVVIVVILSAMVKKLSPGVATFLFFIYSVLNGIVFSTLFLAFELTTMIYAFAITSVIFLVMAILGYTTKRDLTRLGSILLTGLLCYIIFSLIGMLFGFGTDSLLINLILVGLFMGITAYDMQMLKRYYAAFNSDEAMLHKSAIIVALQLYLDFINIFVRILSLFRSRD